MGSVASSDERATNRTPYILGKMAIKTYINTLANMLSP
jgi:hypothetical protein